MAVERMVLASSGVAAAVARAVELLRRPGAVLLVPTETVYGLVCRADDAEAVERIYNLKDRDHSKKLALFIGDWRKLAARGVQLDGLPARLAEKYCPGAVTIIARGADGGTVGFRVPDHPLILALLRAIDFPLASTSANHSGHPNALHVDDALGQLNGEPDLAIDGGAIPADAQASTVIDATGDVPKILRQGPVTVQL